MKLDNGKEKRQTEEVFEPHTELLLMHARHLRGYADDLVQALTPRSPGGQQVGSRPGLRSSLGHLIRAAHRMHLSEARCSVACGTSRSRLEARLTVTSLVRVASGLLR